jgi:hypothetical protein
MRNFKLILLAAFVAAGLSACSDDTTLAAPQSVSITELVKRLIGQQTSDSAAPTSINDADLIEDASDTAEAEPVS